MLFLKSINSPFKLIKPKFYVGKIAIGCPIFFPRVWKRYTHENAIEAAVKALNNDKLKQRSFEEWVDHYKGYQKAFPKKIGFDFVDLGWKTKWTDTDYRFEWSPVWSFVFFGYQIAIVFAALEPHHYWECFLYYHFNTKGTTRERIAQCRKGFPCIWTTHRSDEEKETIDY